MLNLKNISEGLKESGINSVNFNEKILTHWIAENSLKIEIVIFLVGNEEWVKLAAILQKIDSNNEKKNKLIFKMNRLNNKILGCKFSIDQKNQIICSSELHEDAFNFIILKKLLMQIVKAISTFKLN